ncbi:MAG: PilT/PilU family type 4a pilus ATPase [Candidatus Pelagadaptatus aseana]|uniref:PilT/PilU family type 4a pilus ATPase n=1 Tax=Candidatus Pelagadaptatus aseana TaxID=3120508 RepID=UPI0039B30DFE
MADILRNMLSFCVKSEGSDLYIYSDARPMIKIHGECQHLSTSPLSLAQVGQIVSRLLTPQQQEQFEEEMELSTSVTFEDIGRFRINVFRERGKPTVVARLIKGDIPAIEELDLPSVLGKLSLEKRGLVLVVGATGQGKSTTLAAMIKHRAAKKNGHIICIEDPIEFIHSHDRSLIGQREIGVDTRNYNTALKNAMRESPDAIMIGEILDEETMSSAIKFADTGHLCLATLHAVNANQALDRIINMYPESLHDHVRQDLAMNLKAIISMRLPKGVNGKRVPVVEVMLNTPHVQDLIRKGHIEELKEAILESIDDGGQSFDHALYQMVREEKIDQHEALRWADSATDLSLRLRFD